MGHKFFDNSINTTFIQYLLRYNPLPIFKTISSGDYIFEGVSYIYKRDIIKCLSSGYFLEYEEISSGDITISDYAIVGSQQNIARYKVVDTYTFGETKIGVTETIIPKYSFYDSYTHICLGKFLRAFRDIYDINLMQLYNCFSYEFSKNVFLTESNNGYTDREKKDYKVLSIPIQYNTDYTIAIDCDSPVLMKSVIISDLGLTKSSAEDLGEYLTDSLEELNPVKTATGAVIPVTKFTNLRFNSPITYRINNFNKRLSRYEKYLRLLIQLPKSNDSSIVVIEGKPSIYAESIFSMETFIETDIETGKDKKVSASSLSNKELNQLLTSKLSLLEVNNKVNYAFADRLLEYLYKNVIDSTETIDGNIKWVQKTERIPYDALGAWNNNIRLTMYSKFMNSNIYPKYDINGFVDKDVEQLILRTEGRK